MKKYNTLIFALCCLVLLFSACKKSLKEDPTRTLDANFSFEIKPNPGAELVVNLYYTDQKDEPFYERQADVVLRRTLSEHDIENGFTLTFEDVKESPFAYVTAYVDVDGDHELSEGDIAICYYGQSLRDVMRGLATAENSSHRIFVTMKMDQVYSTLLSFEADFTFPIQPAVGTALIFNLYYAGQEEPRFFERQPDVVKTGTLTEADIENGLRISLDDLEDWPFIYASAYLDIDGNGELNHGDIATVYNGKSLREVMEGHEVADNIAGKAGIVIDLAEWFIDDDGPVVDIDGNVYTTVVIGNKEWIVENLKVTRYRNGAPITTNLSNAAWNSTTANEEGAYAVYPYSQAVGVDSEEQMVAQYGLLYNAYAVEDPRELAPVGWRIATDKDYKELEILIGFTQQQADNTGWRGVGGLKLRSTTGWPINNGTDDFGFKALPGGCREQGGTYNFFNVRANFWTGTVNETNHNAQYRRIFEDTQAQFLNRSSITKREGYSVRCVRDIQ